METQQAPTPPVDEAELLDTLAAVDFHWADQATSVWEDDPRDVPEIHEGTLRKLDRRLTQADRSRAGVLGSVVVGAAGSGKTHLLGALRRRTWERGGTFILIDLTGVRDFSATVVLGFLRALEHRLPDGMLQHEKLLERLANGFIGPGCGDIVRDIRVSRDPVSIQALQDGLERGLAAQMRPELLAHLDVLRALVRFSIGRVEDADVAYNWLQGAEIAEATTQLGLRQASRPAWEIIQGLSWLMSLTGPTVIGIDQLDAIVSAYHLLARGDADDPDTRRARAIVDGVAVGLMDLVNSTRRTLAVACCLETTWEYLKRVSLASAVQRFEPEPIALESLQAGEAARALIERRLAPAYAESGLVPPYPSWPFRPDLFSAFSGATPRWLLMKCDAHVRRCLDRGHVEELGSFVEPSEATAPAPAANTFDADFKRLKQAANPAALAFDDDRTETPVRRLLEAVGRLFALQNGGHPDIDIRIEKAFDPRRPALHLRVAHMHRIEGDREEVFAFRFLPHHNAISFQGRLTAAMTQAGIDRQLKFRHLVILRAGPPPSGRKTADLVQQFRDKGGLLLAPNDDDLRSLLALATMEQQKAEGFGAWLVARRPLDDLTLARKAGDAWPRLAPPPPLPTPPKLKPWVPPVAPAGKAAAVPAASGADPERVPDRPPVPPPAAAPQPAPVVADPPDRIPLGLSASERKVSLPLALMKKHVAIVAGSGSGKTVLLRRMIEEAVRRGVPAIVVDTNNDLALLGERWPDPSPLKGEDVAAADDYFARAEVVVWTPGLAAGNPMTLPPLPDFSSLRGDADELEGAVELACTTLEAHVASGSGRANHLRQGLLRSAMRYFALHGSGGFTGFIGLLDDLPAEADAGISKADKLAREMADSLRAAIARNPLMAAGGVPLDPERLITPAQPGKVRVSVLNLSGLASLPAQQSFVNRLALALFTFVRRNPATDGRVKALLAIDEAHQFAPARTATPSRESLISLAKQARKYGLGLLFATQMPKDLHNGITNNCATQIFGKAGAPVVIDTIRELMAARGRDVGDVARLSTGMFYLCADADRPEKVTTPLCLSHHPAAPPDGRRLLELAANTRPDLA